MSLRALLSAGLFLIALLGSDVARADTTCTASAPTTLPFGTITNGATGVTDASITITITCSTAALSLLATASVRMCIGLGTGTTGTTLLPSRSMAISAAPPQGNGDTLAYQLYSNPNRTTPWGLAPAGTPAAVVADLTYAVPLLGGSGSTTVTLYGRIPAAQTLSAGTFSSSYAGANVNLQYAYNERLALTSPTPATCNAASGVTGTKSATNAFTFTTSATVLPQCSTYVTTDMDFGSNAGAFTANLDRTSTIRLTCINRTAYNIGLSNGQNALGNVRRMRFTAPDSSAYYIPYELYRDAARSQRWGNTINTDTQAGTGTGSAQTLTVYGRAPPTTGAIPAQGSYSDLITVTITY